MGSRDPYGFTHNWIFDKQIAKEHGCPEGLINILDGAVAPAYGEAGVTLAIVKGVQYMLLSSWCRFEEIK